MSFGEYIRKKREALREGDRSFSLRATAKKIGVQPSYLSKVERGDEPPPSEEKIVLLAKELGENQDLLLAMAGKVSSDLRDAICKRPLVFAEVIRALKDTPDNAVLRMVREVRDGNW